MKNILLIIDNENINNMHEVKMNIILYYVGIYENEKINDIYLATSLHKLEFVKLQSIYDLNGCIGNDNDYGSEYIRNNNDIMEFSKKNISSLEISEINIFTQLTELYDEAVETFKNMNNVCFYDMNINITTHVVAQSHNIKYIHSPKDLYRDMNNQRLLTNASDDTGNNSNKDMFDVINYIYALKQYDLSDILSVENHLNKLHDYYRKVCQKYTDKNSKIILRYAINQIMLIANNIVASINKYKNSYIDSLSRYNRITNKKLQFIFNKRIIHNFINKETNNNIIDVKLDVELEDSDELDEACDLFCSPITLSNWYEEIQEGNVMGLMINIKTTDNLKLSFRSAPEIALMTNDVISIKDYMESLEEYNTKENKTGNLDLNGQDIFKDQGKITNAIIPLYIHKEHWKIAQQHIPTIYGIILAHNPNGYCPRHLNFNFYLLMEMMHELCIKNINCTIKDIKIFMALFRTCAEISYERNYNIKKMVLNNIANRDNDKKINNEYDNMTMLGQILSSSCITRKLLTNENIRDICYGMIENNNNNKLLELLIFFLGMYQILKIKIGFRKFLAEIDECYSNYPDVKCLDIKTKITDFTLNNQPCYNTFSKCLEELCK